MDVGNKNKSVVTNIQGYSIHDGPGIRTVVFFKGCPLRCRWCANPENLVTQVQIGFLSRLCAGCGKCLDVCQNGAILPVHISDAGMIDPDERRIDREKCVVCGACVKDCFYGALVKYGEPMDAEEIFEKVRRDKIFYDASGGGVTVSGGEPLMQPELVSSLFLLCKQEGIDTCIETCGYVPVDAMDKVLEVTDHFCFDLKLMDDEAHMDQTGVSNDRILENAGYLASKGADVLFRLPLVPGVNDSEENTKSTAEFLMTLPDRYRKIELMPFHRAGQSKYNALDMEYEFGAQEAMSPADIDKVCMSYRAKGIDCTISR